MVVQYLNNSERLNHHIRQMESLLLDFDGTLVDYITNEYQALSALLKPLGYDERECHHIVNRYKIINDHLWKQYEKHILPVEEIKTRRFKELADEFEIDLDPAAFNEKYLRNFEKYAVPFPGILKRLHDFRKEFPSIKLVVLTNGTDKVQRTRLANTQLDTVTDAIVSSDEAGIAKPSPQIFDYVGQRHGIDLKQTMMIGDSLSSDILGAINAKIPNCYVLPEVVANKEAVLHGLDPRPDMITESCVSFLDHLTEIRG